MSGLVKVAVGLDYETDMPWVFVDPTDDDPEGYASKWLICEVPAELAEQFRAAKVAIDEAVKAVHEAAGDDPETGRLVAVCDRYDGCYITVNGYRYWDDCTVCGWPQADHQVVAV